MPSDIAGLEPGTHQYGYRAERHAFVLQRLDLLADQSCFLLAVPDAAQRHLFALGFLGPQGLAESAFVMRDEPRGGGKDMRRRAVVALQTDDLGARKIALEP